MPTKPSSTDPWLSPREAAEYLGYSVSWLRKARAERNGPGFVKSPTGSIRYRRSALDNWMESNRRKSS